MRTPACILIVGASAAGLSTAEGLRRMGYDKELVIVGDEVHAPYDRPPLSKRVLAGSWEPARTRLRQQDRLDELDADWQLGNAATHLNLETQRLSIANGNEIAFDRLVVATGTRARRLPFGNDLAGVHVLRTVEDATELRAGLLTGGPFVVIGAGPLGCEVAATARSLGVDVSVVDVLELPMERHLGRSVAAHLYALHLTQGVRFHLGVGIVAIHGEHGQVTAVELSDGTQLPSATVLVAIGASPATAWLRDSGVPLGNGVVCDEYCQATDVVYAAGDVAEWFNPRFGSRMRVEHRMNANEQGMAVAANLLGTPTPFASIPYFWSDQYTVKLQAYGRFASDADVEFESHSDDGSRFAAIYGAQGRTTGVFGWNVPKQMLAYRDTIPNASERSRRD